RNVTVLNVEVSSDLRHAKVFCSVMGDERTQRLSMHGLNSARGFLQAKIADRLQTRYTPVLRFVLDQGVKKSIETSRLLREVLQESQPPESAAAPSDTEPEPQDGGADSPPTDPAP
ncbi:MAG: 30S ribosome-binding factor RbfA, partial [Planctomycetes bacterium]|nr:30S ribosome-binding factor RbfA [Planctomycetota bacterium]